MNPLPEKYRKPNGAWELDVASMPLYKADKPQILLPSTRAMLWTLCTTKVYRIINEKDIKEYLYRLGVVFYVTGIFEAITTDEILFRFTYDGKTHCFTIDDILENLGIQVNDQLFNFSDDFVPGPEFLSKENTYSNALCLLIGGALPMEMPEGMKRKWEGLKKWDKAGEAFAKAFQNHVLRKYFCNYWRQLEISSFEKKNELAARRFYFYNQTSVFDINKLDPKVLKACRDHLHQFSGVSYFVNITDPIAIENALIQLAWLFANEYVLLSGIEYEFQESVFVDEEIYRTENGVLDLGQVSDKFKLRSIEPLLVTPLDIDGLLL